MGALARTLNVFALGEAVLPADMGIPPSPLTCSAETPFPHAAPRVASQHRSGALIDGGLGSAGATSL